MNVRKPIDYSAMFAALDTLMTAEMPQMELYREIGRLVSGRPEKGAAVAAAEYLCSTYPDASGFSPRNLRRMREFYRAYENAPEVLAQAMPLSWTQNVVILEAELSLQERFWYIRAAGQFGWSKLELTRQIKERTHETTALDSAADPCYSNSSGGDEDGTKEKETSGAFLQGLRDAEVQRELQRQGPCGAHLQSLFPSFIGTAGGGNDTAPLGKSAAPPPDRERDDVAEKSNPRPSARGEGAGLHGLCGEISAFGAESEKTGVVDPNAGTAHRRRDLRSLWRPRVCQRELPGQPDTANHRSHTTRWHTSGSRTSAQNPGKAVKVDGTHAGDFLVGRRLLLPCRC